MISLFLGSIPLGTNALTGPPALSLSQRNTFAQHDVTRGKPVLQDVGSELDTQSLSFFFSEEFCDPSEELSKLQNAFDLKSPLPLMFSHGGYSGKRYVVQSLDIAVQKTNRAGQVVRGEASMSLLEVEVPSLLGLITSLARSIAPALSGSAGSNPNVRR